MFATKRPPQRRPNSSKIFFIGRKNLRSKVSFEENTPSGGSHGKAYLEDHFQNVVKFFEKLEECHLKVRFEKCHFFLERIKYCGNVLPGGMRSPAPSKVDEVRNWPKPKTPKQMKGFSGVVNWY